TQAASAVGDTHDEISGDGVILRPATMGDADFLFRLRNDPETRRQSLHEEPLLNSQHGLWLERMLSTPWCHLYVADVGGQPVGTGRLDFHHPEIAEVSLTVAPERRGAGHGADLVAALVNEARNFRCRTLVAEVKGTNPASLLAFLKNGFLVPNGLVRLERQL
ncbi:MAG: GNAT family N-acetyltransferase, partial [Nitrospinota bacterium]